jgi:hypothetical protein
MYKKLLLVLALAMVCTTVSANAALVTRKGPPPNCHRLPLEPRCRP